MPLNLADDKWALVWVMACSHQATSHDLGKYSKLEVRVFLYPLSSAGAELCVVNADGLVFQYQVISSQNTFQHPPGVSGHQWVNEVGEICSGSNQWISSWSVSMSWPKWPQKVHLLQSLLSGFWPTGPWDSGWNFMCILLKCIPYKWCIWYRSTKLHSGECQEYLPMSILV